MPAVREAALSSHQANFSTSNMTSRLRGQRLRFFTDGVEQAAAVISKPASQAGILLPECRQPTLLSSHCLHHFRTMTRKERPLLTILDGSL